MLTTFKELFVPGSVPFLLVALILGVVLLYRRADSGRWGRRWIAALVLMYWIFSMPISAAWLLEKLTPAYEPLLDAGAARGATAIVVLGAGAKRYRSRGRTVDVVTRDGGLRVLEAARVYQLLDRPWVIVSGGFLADSGRGRPEAAITGEELVKLGVPQDRIVLETVSGDTHEHSINVPPLLRERGVERFVLVTSQEHMRRSLRVFRAAGLSPIPSVPEAFPNPPSWRRWFSYVPSTTALEISGSIVYDYFGIGYYWLRGWI